mgnify:CR=1 FL=1
MVKTRKEWFMTTIAAIPLVVGKTTDRLIMETVGTVYYNQSVFLLQVQEKGSML